MNVPVPVRLFLLTRSPIMRIEVCINFSFPSNSQVNVGIVGPKDRTNEPSDEFTESLQQNSAAVRLDTQAQDVDGSKCTSL